MPQVGPQSAGSTPGPAALDRGGDRADRHRRDGDDGLHRPRQLPRRPRAAQARARRARRSTARSASGSAGRPRRPRPRSTTSSSSTWPTPCARSASARATTRATSSSSPTAARCRCSRRRSPSAWASRRSSSRRTARCSARSGCCPSDFVMRSDQGVGWDLSKPDGVGRVNEIADADGRRRRSPEMRREGFADDQIEIQRSARLPFPGPGRTSSTLPMPGRDARPRTTPDALSTSSSRSTSAPTARAPRGRACRPR